MSRAPPSSPSRAPRRDGACPYLLLLRNIIVNPDFVHSAQKVAQEDDAPAAAAAMGPYYPSVSQCPLATLTTKGLSACETH